MNQLPHRQMCSLLSQLAQDKGYFLIRSLALLLPRYLSGQGSDDIAFRQFLEAFVGLSKFNDFPVMICTGEIAQSRFPVNDGLQPPALVGVLRVGREIMDRYA